MVAWQMQYFPDASWEKINIQNSRNMKIASEHISLFICQYNLVVHANAH